MAINNVIHKLEFKSRKHVIYSGKLTVDTTLKTVDSVTDTADLTSNKIIL